MLLQVAFKGIRVQLSVAPVPLPFPFPHSPHLFQHSCSLRYCRGSKHTLQADLHWCFSSLEHPRMRRPLTATPLSECLVQTLVEPLKYYAACTARKRTKKTTTTATRSCQATAMCECVCVTVKHAMRRVSLGKCLFAGQRGWLGFPPPPSSSKTINNVPPKY